MYTTHGLTSGGTNANMIIINIEFNCLVTAEFVRFLYCDVQSVPSQLWPLGACKGSSYVFLEPQRFQAGSCCDNSKLYVFFRPNSGIMRPSSPFPYVLLLGNTVRHYDLSMGFSFLPGESLSSRLVNHPLG